jgi:predicted amidohydrolase
MRLTLAQVEIEPAAKRANTERATSAIERASADGADLVVLPELFTVGYFAFDSYARSAEPLDGDTIQTLAETADAESVAVLAGSIVEDLSASSAAGFETPAKDGLANTAVFLGRDGSREAIYRKHHLFGYDSAEQELLTPGEGVGTVDFEGFTVGMTTCYDLRFPELYRRLVDAGVTLTLVPSAWPYPRVEHWQLFPEARAVENLMYVAAANGVGSFEESTLLGRSAIYDPWGTTLASAGDEATLVTATLDPQRVTERRASFPALDDRR